MSEHYKKHGYTVGETLVYIGPSPKRRKGAIGMVISGEDAKEKSTYGASGNEKEWIYIECEGVVSGFSWETVAKNWVKVDSTPPATGETTSDHFCSCASPSLETRDAGVSATSIPYQFCLLCKKERQ